MAPVPEPDVDKIVQLRLELGMSMREIGRAVHWSPSAVRRALIRRDIDLGHRGGNRRDTFRTDDITRVVFLHDVMGYSQDDIARILGRSRVWVHNRVVRASSSRPRGAAGQRLIKRRLAA